MKKTSSIARCALLLAVPALSIMLALSGCDRIAANDDQDIIQTDQEGSSAVDDTVQAEDTMIDAAYEATDAAPELSSGASSLNILWSSSYGGEKADSARAVAPAADGSLGLAGYTRSSGAGVTDFLAMKLGSDGSVLWSETFGSTDNELAYSMAATADGGFIMAGEKRIYSILDEFNLTSSYRYNFWIIRLDADGDKAWDKKFGGSDYDAANSIAQCADGGFIVAGYTQSFGAEYDPGPHAKKDLWVIRLDADGNKEWETLYGGEFSSENAQSVRQCADGGFIVAGFKSEADTGNYDCLLLKLDGNGDVQWSRTAGGAGFDKALDVIETPAGNFLTAAETASYGAGNTDYYILCHDGSGTLLWSKTFGGAGFERARSIAAAGGGAYMIAGYTGSKGAGSRDMWLVKINQAGDRIWDRTIGGASCDEAFSIAAYPDGSFAVAGNTSSYGSGELDCWVIKFTETGMQ
ncbi:MAG TPA: hypothetical protein P5346_06875 [Spirochaetota bacterium]|nr:hypothetical protein [Spirochaetota bacterium]